MRKIFRQLRRLGLGIFLTFRLKTNLRQKLVLLANFLRIEMKRMFVKVFGTGVFRERFLDYRVSFPDYGAFSNLFLEIFLLQEYMFAGPKDAFIIDCGSNIGMSVLFFKKRFPNCTILAFEPDKTAHEHLVRNIEKNHIQNIQINEAAVFDKDGEVTFFLAAQNDSDALLEMSIFESSLGGRELEHTKVKCVKLSRFIDRPVDLLKLDIQGAETKVIKELADSGKLIEINELIIEYHYDEVNNPLGMLIATLEGNGFYVSVHAFHCLRLPPYSQYRNIPYFFLIYAANKRNKTKVDVKGSQPSHAGT